MTMELEQSLEENKLNNAHFRLSPFRVIITILITDAAGIILKYFGIDTYFIFLGFRFHICALLPFTFLYNKNSLPIIIKALKKPYFKKKFIPVLWILFSLIISLSVLYYLKKVNIGDPDYFYEFGLSSIFDYPLYLIWNFPQLCLLFVTLIQISYLNKYHLLNVFIACLLLFFWEMIPMNLVIDLFSLIPFIVLAFLASLLLTKLQNIYWFALVIFSSVWCIVLLFGSESSAIINLFLAKEYKSWEGFLKPTKDIAAYIIPAYFSILMIIVLLYMSFRRKGMEKIE